MGGGGGKILKVQWEMTNVITATSVVVYGGECRVSMSSISVVFSSLVFDPPGRELRGVFLTSKFLIS